MAGKSRSGLPSGVAGLRVAAAATLGYARSLRHSDEAIIDFDQSDIGNLQTCPDNTCISPMMVPYATTFSGLGQAWASARRATRIGSPLIAIFDRHPNLEAAHSGSRIEPLIVALEHWRVRRHVARSG